MGTFSLPLSVLSLDIPYPSHVYKWKLGGVSLFKPTTNKDYLKISQTRCLIRAKKVRNQFITIAQIHNFNAVYFIEDDWDSTLFLCAILHKYISKALTYLLEITLEITIGSGKSWTPHSSFKVLFY